MSPTSLIDVYPSRDSGRRKAWAAFCVAVLLSCLVAPVSAMEPVGSVVFVKGAVSAQNESGATRLLARDSTVFQRETISTAVDSFVVIRFDDETKMSIRPESEVLIERFNDDPGSEEARFNLVKGGLRAITGVIGSQRPENVRFNTRAASIGIRGTDLVLRLCETDECQLEELALLELEPVRTECLVQIDDQPPGLYFAVLEGAIFSERGDRRVELEAIGAGYASEEEMTCLRLVPRFILNDEFLEVIHLSWQEFELFDVLGLGGDDYPACEIR
jgi:hypothetical protein